MQIRIEGQGIGERVCTVVILVPEKALAEHGFIRTLTVSQTSQSKHEFHALTQTALMLHEDHELIPISVPGAIQVSTADQTVTLGLGVLIGRLSTGEVVVFSNTVQPTRKYLEAAHRFCTRWIRLDL
jgi:hypothetical protein